MKNLPSIIAAIVLLAVLVLYMCTYQVRSTEVAILKTFGQAQQEPIRVPESDTSFFAGLRFKAPWPMQSVVMYDTRIRLLEDRIEETPTRDSKPMIVTTYTGWRIGDPYRFHLQYRTEQAGESALRDRIRTHKKAVVGQHDFSEFVSTRAEDRKLRQIEEEMKTRLVAEARQDFGIDVVMFGIKQLSLPESVTEAVFQTMKTTENNKAENYRSEGQAEAERIRGEAEKARAKIMAVVDRKAKEIQNQGLVEVGALYAKFADHPELRIFLDRLRALEEILRNRAEIFLDTNHEPISLFDAEKRLSGTTTDIDGLAEPAGAGKKAP